MSDTINPDQLELREMTAADAVGVADLARRTYGDDYPYTKIYNPDEFYADQVAGAHTSEVALTPDGELVSHAALAFHGPRVGEGGMAITDERFRGKGIATRLEVNLLKRAKEREIKWLMVEPVLYHVASQDIIVSHWDQGAITGIRIKEFAHADIGGFGENAERGRISATMGFAPLAEMGPHDVWVAPEYAEILEIVLEPVEWHRTIRTKVPDDLTIPERSALTSEFKESKIAGVIEVETIGADLSQAVTAERDALVGKGAEVIELHLATHEPVGATAVLMDEGFSFAGFLPEIRGDSDMLLLQWLADAEIERDTWQLLNDHVERLADAIVAQAKEAFEHRAGADLRDRGQVEGQAVEPEPG